jgi:hypothetical protein
MTTYIDSLKLHPEFINTLREKYWSEWQDSLMREFNIKEFENYKLDPTGDYYILYKYDNNKKIIMVGSKKVYTCENCKIEIDRDINAAINMYKKGLL